MDKLPIYNTHIYIYNLTLQHEKIKNYRFGLNDKIYHFFFLGMCIYIATC